MRAFLGETCNLHSGWQEIVCNSEMESLIVLGGGLSAFSRETFTTVIHHKRTDERILQQKLQCACFSSLTVSTRGVTNDEYSSVILYAYSVNSMLHTKTMHANVSLCSSSFVVLCVKES